MGFRTNILKICLVKILKELYDQPALTPPPTHGHIKLIPYRIPTDTMASGGHWGSGRS